MQRRARLFPHTTVTSEPDVESALKTANTTGKLDVALLFVPVFISDGLEVNLKNVSNSVFAQGSSGEEAARSIHQFRSETGSTLVVISDSEQLSNSVVQAYEQVTAMGVRTLLSGGVANKAVSTRLLDWLLRPGNAQQVTVRNAQGINHDFTHCMSTPCVPPNVVKSTDIGGT